MDRGRWRDGLSGSRSGVANPKKIILAGRSWGGYLTLLGLSLQPERWALGLAGVPVADYFAPYEDESTYLPRYHLASG